MHLSAVANSTPEVRICADAVTLADDTVIGSHLVAGNKADQNKLRFLCVVSL